MSQVGRSLTGVCSLLTLGQQVEQYPLACIIVLHVTPSAPGAAPAAACPSTLNLTVPFRIFAQCSIMVCVPQCRAQNKAKPKRGCTHFG
jgi:hypothetical protein